MQTIDDVHQQFAAFFQSDKLRPYAYLLSKRLSEGHICLQLDSLNLMPDELLYLEKYQPAFTAESLLNEPMVTTQIEDRQPFILHNNRLYLQRYFSYETSILRSIRSLLENENKMRLERQKLLETNRGIVQQLSEREEVDHLPEEERIDWQQVAAVRGVINNFTIITGGPGTGKTTTVAKILAILFTIYPDLKCALAAPTGKAAVRMAESLSASRLKVDNTILEKFKTLVPGTIHRLLKYIPDSPYFRHDASDPVNFDLVIVDEASMIDVALFAKLLDAIGPETRIILLGDKDQLASVEAGSLLGDLCKSQVNMNSLRPENVEWINSFIPDKEKQIPSLYSSTTGNMIMEHIIELKRSRRFTGAGGIGKFSRAIIRGDLDLVAAFTEKGEDPEVEVDTIYSDEIFNQFIRGYEHYVKEKDIAIAIASFNQLRVLCAVREGPQGVHSINRKIETILARKGLLQINSVLYENRPIIITSNYPEFNLFNGDVGLLRRDANGTMKAWFVDSDKVLRAILPGYISNVETVFAMTIHKSQGSEYGHIMVLLPALAGHQLLTRELLYTAVTRAKKKVIVQASKDTILYTTSRTVQRASGIADRL